MSSTAHITLTTLHPEMLLNTILPAIKQQCISLRDETEEAAHHIITTLEAISAITGEKDTDLKSHVTALFEQCHFQDFAGQRAAEIEKHLHTLEVCLRELLTQCQFNAPKEYHESHAESLMHGPQHKASAASQDDIDALFSS